MVRGQWLVDEAASGNILPRCQDLPPEALYKGPIHSKVKVLCLSYCWADRRHADPNGEQLRSVAPIVQWYLNDQDTEEVAVFWDFVSLPQQAVEYSPGVIKKINEKKGSVRSVDVHFEGDAALTEEVDIGNIQELISKLEPGQNLKALVSEMIEKGEFLKIDDSAMIRRPRSDEDTVIFKFGLGTINVWCKCSPFSYHC